MSALFAFACLQAMAQKQDFPLNEPDYNKPKLFAELPQKMTVKLTAVDAALRLSAGATVSLQLSDKLTLEGTIVSADLQDPALQSIVIRCSNRQDAILTLTRSLNADRSYGYSGRIMSKNNSDAYEIVLENGSYILQKKNYYDLMNE
ncbi:MAG TPA: hypothetical protein VFR58_13375 [Flavisolibacter sp.]|nr:hypothetical protein [Flavisolibacter sp.]